MKWMKERFFYDVEGAKKHKTKQPWEKDYLLTPLTEGLFSEYLEMCKFYSMKFCIPLPNIPTASVTCAILCPLPENLALPNIPQAYKCKKAVERVELSGYVQRISHMYPLQKRMLIKSHNSTKKF